MRLIRMFGLAVIAAIMTTAFAGASSAVAGSTLLCTKNTPTLTPNATECAAPSTVHFVTVGKATLLSSILNVECDALLIWTVTDTTLVTSGPVRITVVSGGLIYSNCSNFCTVTTLEGGTILVLKTGVELSTVTADAFRVEVDCPLFTCDYNAVGLSGHGLAQGAVGRGHVTYTKSKVNLLTDLANPVGSCPSDAFLDALFQSLTPIYLRA